MQVSFDLNFHLEISQAAGDLDLNSNQTLVV